MANETHTNRGFLAKAHLFLFYLGIIWAVAIALLAIPPIQRHAAYQHSFKFPLFAKFDTPEKYGLAPGKTLNCYFTTPDHVKLGAWFVLADQYHNEIHSNTPVFQSPTLDTVKGATAKHPTVLFLHGAAATRAVEWRVRLYMGFTSRLGVNVFAPDYRGFADSEGVPDQPGLELDAYTAWKWLIEQGAKAEDILIVGHSLGTGVASQLAKRLAAEGAKPRGIVLLAPFSSLTKLVETYSIFGLPVLQPLQSYSMGVKLLKKLIHVEFDTLSVIENFHVPTLIAHSQDDFDIPYSHAQTLVDKLLSPLLPELPTSLPDAPGSSITAEEYQLFVNANNARREARAALVRKTEVPNFGLIEQFETQKAKVVYVETFWGSHAQIGVQEGVQDEIGKLFGLRA